MSIATPVARRAAASTLTLVALAALGAGAVVVSALASRADPDEGWLRAAQLTARFSFALFMLVFVARPWHQLWPSGATRWAMRRRRALGLAFAAAHFIHLFALTRFRVETDQPPNLGQIVVGGGAYLMLVAMVATSNDAAVRRLGRGNWQRLHRVGLWWIWFVFFQAYLGRAIRGDRFFVPLALVAVAGVVLRIAARRRPAA